MGKAYILKRVHQYRFLLKSNIIAVMNICNEIMAEEMEWTGRITSEIHDNGCCQSHVDAKNSGIFDGMRVLGSDEMC